MFFHLGLYFFLLFFYKDILAFVLKTHDSDLFQNPIRQLETSAYVESIFASGRVVLLSSTTPVSSSIPLPQSSAENASYVLFSGVPNADNTSSATFVGINSEELAGKTFMLGLYRTCNAAQFASTTVTWLAVRTGLFYQGSESNAKYILSGISTADTTGGITINLTHPTSPSTILFSETPLVIAQLQNVPPAIASLRLNVIIVQQNSSSIRFEIKTLSGVSLPPGLRIGYLIMTNTRFSGIDQNLALFPYLINTSTSSTSSIISQDDVNCGPITVFATPEATSASPPLFVNMDFSAISASPIPSKTAIMHVASAAECTRSPVARSSRLNALLYYSTKACVYRTLPEMNLSFVSPTMTTTPIPPEGNSTTIVWISIGAILLVIGFCVVLYFFCYRPRQRSSLQATPGVNPQVPWVGAAVNRESPFAPMGARYTPGNY